MHEIHRVLKDARPEFREVFLLFHEHGQSYEEVAEALGCPVGTVKTWLHRARVEVLTRLRQRGIVEPGPERSLRKQAAAKKR
jgi:RNA polymerase sigma-70 factor (ECF subfamily)